ncbi:MAG: Asp-tRNA(Asn)/Glu-tRNA(Gln) amidotransferase subunit GatB [bacterium]|nr:Asp-tRNA(Asn)/Glu-tRNA(Gln) amidotransferase subunit GatB [bacterium]
MKYVVVIGIEVHIQLKTGTKIFCGCDTGFGAEPNTLVCPVCLGFPGVLPVLNQRVVEYAILASLALNCKITPLSRFHRKNYFYPDLPKAYQISQYDEPLAVNGYIDIFNGKGEKDEKDEKKIRITRAHLEEDAGKLIHSGEGISLVDYNRTGVPLLEIVSQPDISTPQEAYDYLTALKAIIKYTGVSDCNMEEGSLRCDANISIKPAGDIALGTKAEIKNLNSFRAVEKALTYEIQRQTKLVDSGGSVVQETRLWDEKKQITSSMRSKEEAHDYRYFPDPDLMPIQISQEYVQSIQETIPELPQTKAKRFVSQYSLPEYDVHILVADKYLADFYEKTVHLLANPKMVSNWIITELLCLLGEARIGINDCQVTPEHLSKILQMIEIGTISGKIGKDVLLEVFKTGMPPEQIVKEKGLVQITDTNELESMIDKILQENPKAVEQYREGKKQALGFFVGQVMRMTSGKAQPEMVNKILQKRLE